MNVRHTLGPINEWANSHHYKGSLVRRDKQVANEPNL